MSMPPLVPIPDPAGATSPFWIKFTRALKGWKLYVGALVFYTPEILEAAPGLLVGLGVSPEGAEPILKVIGSALMLVGFIHKIIKFTAPLDRREDRQASNQIKRTAFIEEGKSNLDA